MPQSLRWVLKEKTKLIIEIGEFQNGPSLKTVQEIKHLNSYIWFSSVQSLSHVRLFATPRITARQASLSITISRSSLNIQLIYSSTEQTFIESVLHTSLWAKDQGYND